MKAEFLIDPDVVFLNHGSFGATPRPVFANYQAWQWQLERQPVQFIQKELWNHLAQARQQLGHFVGANGDDLVFIPNATFGLNIVARSLVLGPGDDVLTTDHEYGACTSVWQFLSQKRGFGLVQQPISVPLTTPEAIVDQLWQGVTPRTRVIFLSHISSSTAVCFPVAEICHRARQAGILTIIDGAHAPGQLPLDLSAIDPDFYFGNLHKWLCSPKGSAFLYARADKQSLIEPLVVGWGWGPERTLSFGSDFLDYNQWLGTNDVSAYLAVPAAIQFQVDHDWTAVRQNCHQLLTEAIRRICALTGLPSIYPDGGAGFYHQMATVQLPQLANPEAFKAALLQQFNVEVPIVTWNGRHHIRISVQAYNTSADIDILLQALAVLLSTAHDRRR
ncbi:aminotransferase class V-fold PLP-dependent enzyme [Candidatus Leptofilum sp.]|uniref:aminotransferase class V-fold PLP-dependent enzyme n=1 Tax=Candidatus Leptofilum sp. TaxID=3241576 RepID=UPI003B5AE044